MKTQFFASAHSIKRFKARVGIKRTTPWQEVLTRMTQSLEQALPQIRLAKTDNRPINIAGDVYYLQPLYGLEGEAFLVKSFWCAELTGLAWFKQKLKSRLLKILTEW